MSRDSFRVEHCSNPNPNPERFLEIKIKELENLIGDLQNFKKNKNNFSGKFARNNLEKGLVRINKTFDDIIKNDGIEEVLNNSEEALKRKFLNLKSQIEDEIKNNDYILFKMIVKDTENLSTKAQHFCNELQIKNRQQSIDLNIVRRDMKRATEEARESKKDLVSIMGLFIGVFIFFQLNFSQMDNLGKYDAFDRVLYLLVFNLVFLLGIFFMFMIIDFIVHKDPRMLKGIYDKDKNRLTKVGVLGIVSIVLILGISLFFLKNNSDNRFKKLESKILENKSVVEKDLKKIEGNIKDSLDKMEVNVQSNLEKVNELKNYVLNLKSEIKKSEESDYVKKEILRIEREIFELEKKINLNNENSKSLQE